MNEPETSETRKYHRSSFVWTYFRTDPDDPTKLKCFLPKRLRFDPQNPAPLPLSVLEPDERGHYDRMAVCGASIARDRTGSTGVLGRHLRRVHNLGKTDTELIIENSDPQTELISEPQISTDPSFTAIISGIKNNIDMQESMEFTLLQRLQTVESAGKECIAVLSAAHTAVPTSYGKIAKDLQESGLIQQITREIYWMKDDFDSFYGSIPNNGKLGGVSSFVYRPSGSFFSKWASTMQRICFILSFQAYLAAFSAHLETGEPLGFVIKPESIARVLQIHYELDEDINSEISDVFTLTVEDYLIGLTNLSNELSSFAPNMVVSVATASATVATSSQKRKMYAAVSQIADFVRMLQKGFLQLNFKNDLLRRRNDSLKYDVKKLEGIIYDLTLRGLIETGR